MQAQHHRGACKCRVHVTCILDLVNAKDEEINRIRSSKTTLFYACAECSARVGRESDSSNFFDFNTQLESSEKKNRAEILKLKRELETAQAARAADNAALQDLQNEQRRLAAERAQLAKKEAHESKKRKNNQLDQTVISTDNESDDTEGNFSTFNKLTDNLAYTVDGIRKEMAAQFQTAITILTEKFVEMIKRNNILIRNELLNMPSTSASAMQKQQSPTVNDLLLDNFPNTLAPTPQLNFPLPLQPIATLPLQRQQPRQRQQTTQPKIKATFAAVLTRSKEKPEAIRNIRTTGTDEQIAVTMAEPQRDYACINNKIKAIKSKGPHD